MELGICAVIVLQEQNTFLGA